MRAFILFITALYYSSWAVAWETDQYTLSQQPIAEMGEEVSRYIFVALQQSLEFAEKHRATHADKLSEVQVALAEKKHSLKQMNRFVSQPQMASPIAQTNQQINSLELRLQHYQDYDQDYYQRQETMARLVSETVGRLISSAEQRDAIWGDITELTPYPSGVKAQQAVVFYPGKLGTIYAYAGFHRLLHPSHFVLSSTIKLYAIEIGMDKLGHVFNEGFQYYQRYHQVIAAGHSEHLALQSAVSWGGNTENTYFGRWVSGIYSNADLASNYAGLHFYRNLFTALSINGVSYPAILSQNEQGDYQLNIDEKNQPQQLFKRFVSEHMNEALNPSSLEYLQYVVINRAIKSRCPLWRERYPNAQILSAKMAHLDRWNGDDYGFSASNTIDLYERCFSVHSQQL